MFSIKVTIDELWDFMSVLITFIKGRNTPYFEQLFYFVYAQS